MVSALEIWLPPSAIVPVAPEDSAYAKVTGAVMVEPPSLRLPAMPDPSPLNSNGSGHPTRSAKRSGNPQR